MTMSTETLQELGLPPLPGAMPSSGAAAATLPLAPVAQKSTAVAPPAAASAAEDERKRRANGASAGRSLRALAAAAQIGGRERAVVAATLSSQGMKAALRVLKGPRPTPRAHLATIDAVGGLLRMYDTAELDRLLLECDPGERRFLLSCLIK